MSRCRRITGLVQVIVVVEGKVFDAIDAGERNFWIKEVAQVKRARKGKGASFELALAILSTHLFRTTGTQGSEAGAARGGTAGPAFRVFVNGGFQIDLSIFGLIVVWATAFLILQSRETRGEGTM